MKAGVATEEVMVAARAVAARVAAVRVVGRAVEVTVRAAVGMMCVPWGQWACGEGAATPFPASRTP